MLAPLRYTTLLILLTFSNALAQVSQAWSARYDGPGGGDDRATRVAIDAGGNVYVTGSSSGQFATVKYDSDGKELWVARYDEPGAAIDLATALVLHSSGNNVYVYGISHENSGSGPYHYATVKYDSDGNQLWIARFEGYVPEGYSDYEPSALSVDSAGNVFVAGAVRGPDQDSDVDWALVKYDLNGNQLWVDYFDGTSTNSNDLPTGLALDGAGNVYVLGVSHDGTTYYTTIKYASDGSQVWLVRHEGLIEDLGDLDENRPLLAVDDVGNAYVTGTSGEEENDLDWMTIKYDSDGNQLWVAFYDRLVPDEDGDLEHSQDEPRALAVDGAGNVYVTGDSWGLHPSQWQTATVKYDSNGTQVWGTCIGGNGPCIGGTRHVSALAIDESGNVYLSGSVDRGSIIAKYHSSGAPIPVWVAEDLIAYPTSLALDSAGNVYVTGTIFASDQNFATAKYVQGDSALQKPGDCNQDGTVDISDAICIFVALFLAQLKGLPCGNGSPTDGANILVLDWQPDRRVDISDGIALLQYLFFGGPAHTLSERQCVPVSGCSNVCRL